MAATQLELPPQSSPPLIGSPWLFTTEWYLLFNGIQRGLTSADSRVGAIERAGNAVAYGTHAIRLSIPATSVPDASMFVETDRNGLVYQVQTRAWVYVSGTYQRTQAQLAALIATLTTADVGLRIFVTDYVHTLWCTAATTVGWAPEDDHRAGEISHFDVDPGTGWKLLNGNGDDGSAIGGAHPISILKSDGTTRNNTTATAQNAGVHLRGAAAYNGAVTAPTVPVISTPTITVANTTLTQAGFTAGAVVADTTATHNHTATSTTPTATLPGDPVSFSDALPFIRK